MMPDNSPPSGSSFMRTGRSLLSPGVVIVLLTLLALFLRLWRLEENPPGWRDDELINSLVISQKVLDGDWAIYFSDASGHEALYHFLSAVTLGIFGPGTAGIRWLPAILGTLTIPLTYLVASRLYGKKVGFLAAALLTISFWSLMYSRIGIRHISMPVFMLAAFYAFLRAMKYDYSHPIEEANSDHSLSKAQVLWFLAAGLLIGLGFYTYFSSRGVPGIILIFLVYLLFFQIWRLRPNWQGLLLMFAVAAVFALPLIITLNQQPEAEARVSELAAPLSQALEGDFDQLLDHTGRTLRMFLNTGDDEWLYNIPFRPVFSGVGALFFWIGVGVAVWYTLKPLGRILFRLIGKEAAALKPTYHMEAASAFLLLWWIAGIAPGFVSVPAASLGHTIAAQSAAYILIALPLLPLQRLSGKLFNKHWGAIPPTAVLPALASLILIVSIAWRDLPDYFVEWPQRGMVRFLYRADINDLADYLEEHPELTDFGISSLLAGPWDRLALDIALEDDHKVHPRWFNPERSVLLETNGDSALSFTGYPTTVSPYSSFYQPVAGQTAGGFQLSAVNETYSDSDDPICFRNGLCLESAQYENDRLELTWEIQRPVDLPPNPLISNPPPPGIYSGPRLLVFAQLLDNKGDMVAGDDGLWIDVTSLKPGDRFSQLHFLTNPGNAETIIYGLYDPKTGQRILTTDGLSQLQQSVKIDR
jgi:4-amino-4-deoxy-L-arabinose transferase-like glycosyltransferase